MAYPQARKKLCKKERDNKKTCSWPDSRFYILSYKLRIVWGAGRYAHTPDNQVSKYYKSLQEVEKMLR
jgi:hypothetical protein